MIKKTMICQAQTKDLPTLFTMFLEMLDYMRDNGVETFCHDDPDQLTGGVMEMLVGKMQNPHHVVLVKEENGKVAGLLVRMVGKFPGFYKHRITAFLEYVYLLTFASTPLAEAFYQWGREQGATTCSCMFQLVQDKLLAMYERQGFNAKQIVMTREI